MSVNSFCPVCYEQYSPDGPAFVTHTVVRNDREISHSLHQSCCKTWIESLISSQPPLPLICPECRHEFTRTDPAESVISPVATAASRALRQKMPIGRIHTCIQEAMVFRNIERAAEAITALCERNTDQVPYETQEAALTAAVQLNLPVMLQLLIAQGVSFVEGAALDDIFHTAISHKFFDILEQLLSHRERFPIENLEVLIKKTASINGHEALKVIFNSGLSVPRQILKQAILIAMTKNSWPALRLLLSQGGLNENERKAALTSSVEHRSVKLAECLLENFQISTEYMNSLITVAVNNEDREMLLLFLKKEYINEQRRGEWVNLATKKTELELVSLLLGNRPILQHLRDEAILAAFELHHEPIFKQLALNGPISPRAQRLIIFNNAKLEHPNNKLMSILNQYPLTQDQLNGLFLKTVGENDIVLTRLLLGRGKILELYLGYAVCLATNHGHQELVELLLQYGKIPPNSHENAVQIARNRNFPSILQLLSRYNIPL